MALTEEQKIEFARNVRENSVAVTCVPEGYEDNLLKADCEETYIETSEGKTHIFIIRAKNKVENCPIHINIHGGGFVRPHAERDIMYSCKVADAIQGIVVDIDYKLAPEYAYPVAFNECYDVTKWVFANIDSLGGDKNRVSIGGHSAGGSLTAAIALKANQTKDFKVCLQVIDYGCMDMVTDPADKPEADTNMIPPQRCRIFTSLYTDDKEEVIKDPYVSMCCASDDMLSGLPEALVITAGFDNFRFEDEAYAMRMVAAGVKVTIQRFLESKHGFMIHCNGEWEEGQKLIIQTIKQAAIQ